MTDIEKRILENQTEILWTLRHLVTRADPDLVGHAGALDRMRGDLLDAAKRTRDLLDTSSVTRPQSRDVDAPEGFVSVELLQIERDTADRLREENARLRALIPPQKERNRFCANADCHYPDCLVGGACPSQPQEGGK